MNIELITLLRAISGVLLFTLLLALMWLVWRDLKATEQQVSSGRRPLGRLTVVEPVGKTFIPTGQIYPLLTVTTIGRSPGSTIMIDDSFVSSEHAVIAMRGGQWWLEDRGSRNGTQLNDMTIAQPVIVTNGDIVCVGQKRFRIELEH
ncbi:MAG: FHA domain-containing protein [Pleurocapsa minor GSE-CHR-MK-17-07R]|nr:FHA domain-containing protein [Pleurocapsa minor GSE-CHR-MK 17-07R]